VEEDPGRYLEMIAACATREEAALKLGCSTEYLQAISDRYEEAPGAMDVEDFPLGAGEAIPVNVLPDFLHTPLPKDAKARGRWPGGAKSPSWFKRISWCPRNHACRYRHKRPDPSGLDAIVGNAIHGALQDAALYRLYKRSGVPMRAGAEELLYHLERQPEVVHDRGTEVLKRARLIIENMADPVVLSNVWAAEFVWSFNASAGLLIAGIADLILVYLDPHNPTGPPLNVIVVDYKTGPGHVPDKEELRSDPQACLQLIWAKRFFHGAKRVQFRLWNVAQNQSVTIDWDHEIERATLSYVRACWNVWTKKDERANVTPRCRYCPYRSDCKAYQQTLNAEAYRSKESLEDKEIDELMEIYYRCRVIGDLAETRRKDVAALIMGMLAPGQKSFRSSRFLALKKSRKVDTFPSVSDTLFKVGETSGVPLDSLLDACTSLGDGRKLKTFIRTLPDAKRKQTEEIVNALKQKRSSPPWIEVRESGNAGF
jgi:RecB family exonuclease